MQEAHIYDTFLADRVYLFSRDKGYLMLRSDLRDKHNITRIDITVPTDSSCFGTEPLNGLIHNVIGYDTLVMNWLISVFGGQGYLYNVYSKDMFNLNLATEFRESTGRANRVVLFKVGGVVHHAVPVLHHNHSGVLHSEGDPGEDVEVHLPATTSCAEQPPLRASGAHSCGGESGVRADHGGHPLLPVRVLLGPAARLHGTLSGLDGGGLLCRLGAHGRVHETLPPPLLPVLLHLPLLLLLLPLRLLLRGSGHYGAVSATRSAALLEPL
eukprot:CAMPEP_0182437194 /NCGR_PEP_ID=MMETSP1167-20130531/84876_1 /TAXON_ID=2988 /ORGANISM="Mallomonas Sp, Strain CCMP3275" /LENGTH=268 /DNA_ID=CAMNT_0024630015 /DNA_START=129 /DNA_END=934 /DNA_ORIENTATION=-